jgi:hypothetical protein
MTSPRPAEPGAVESLKQDTIADFGDQWTRYMCNHGLHVSQELFADILNVLKGLVDFCGRRVLNIGSGSRCILQKARASGAGQVTAVEPSDAYDVLVAYRQLCHVLPLILRYYLEIVLFRMSRDKRRLVIYDQFNPVCAKYDTREEAMTLPEFRGFRNLHAAARRGCSWTVVGEK